MKPAENTDICNEEVFAGIHANHATSLRNFLYYRFGDLEKATDYVQDTFIKLWDNCSKVQFEKVRSFLFTTANRLFLDYTDHQKVVMKFERRSDRSEDQLATNPEYLYREAEFKESLEGAIGNLPTRQREVFLMSRIDKIPNKEIAEALDISIKAVEKNITSALKNLRESLDELNHLKI